METPLCAPAIVCRRPDRRRERAKKEGPRIFALRLLFVRTTTTTTTWNQIGSPLPMNGGRIIIIFIFISKPRIIDLCERCHCARSGPLQLRTNSNASGINFSELAELTFAPPSTPPPPKQRSGRPAQFHRLRGINHEPDAGSSAAGE